MTSSTSVRLERAIARMSAPLVSERARDRLLAFSSVACPNVDLIYVEYRVSSDVADQVDVSVSAAGFPARAALAGQMGHFAARRVEPWAAASRALDRWCRRDTEEGKVLGAACLEYDLDPGQADPLVPSLFFNAGALSDCWDLERTRRSLQQVLTWVLGEPLPASRNALDAVLLALPQNFQLAHLGFMFSRADESLRFDLAVPTVELDAVLRRLGWAGSLKACREFIALADRGGWVTLALGFGASGMTERLGIEVFPRADQANASALLATLVEQRWCTPAKGQALAALLGERDGDRSELSHAKLVVHRDGATETKAYLTLAPLGARMGRLAALRQIRARTDRATPAGRQCPAGAD
jgi:hypothetical protein